MLKKLLTLAVSIIVLLPNHSYASLIESEIFGFGANSGFKIQSESLHWLDLSLTYQLDIGQVNQKLDAEWAHLRWATLDEVFSLWDVLYFSKMQPNVQLVLPTLTNPMPLIDGAFISANEKSDNPNTDEYLSNHIIMGVSPTILMTDIGWPRYYSYASAVFESIYNNYSYATVSISKEALYKSCDPSPCFEQPLSDYASVWSFDGALSLLKSEPDTYIETSSFSNLLVVKTANVPEPNISLIFVGFLLLLLFKFTTKAKIKELEDITSS